VDSRCMCELDVASPPQSISEDQTSRYSKKPLPADPIPTSRFPSPLANDYGRPQKKLHKFKTVERLVFRCILSMAISKRSIIRPSTSFS